MSDAGAPVVVAGVGGIGTPCAWALSRAGVPLIVVDPDVVDPSNLPRQVLYGLWDVGRPKAVATATRLRAPGRAVEAIVGEIDKASVERGSVVVDATDGARAKDLVNSLSVAARVPLLHAAAIGSEGRLLDVPAGGRPCLACLFGWVSEAPDASGDCARFGVWPAVPGVAGFLAAAGAVARRAAPDAPSTGLRVLDLRDGRASTLRPSADAACVVCGGPEPRLPPAAGGGPVREGVWSWRASALDLTGEACPMNLLRAKKALEQAEPGEVVEILLGEDGAESVPDGLVALGHEVLLRESRAQGVRLRVRRAPASGCGVPLPAREDPMEDAWLRRYARQIVLPEVGEAGQRRWQGARVLVSGSGDAFLAAALFLATAGVGTLRLFDPSPVSAADDGAFPFPSGCAGRRRDEVLAQALAQHAGTACEPVRHAVVEETESVDAVALAGGATGAAGILACRSQEAQRPWIAVAGDGAQGLRLRSAHDGDVSPFLAAPASGPIALAGGALLADAVLRRLLAPDAPVGRIHVAADATVSSARSA